MMLFFLTLCQIFDHDETTTGARREDLTESRAISLTRCIAEHYYHLQRISCGGCQPWAGNRFSKDWKRPKPHDSTVDTPFHGNGTSLAEHGDETLRSRISNNNLNLSKAESNHG